MKTFENKQTSLNTGATTKARYADLALTVLDQPPERGFTPQLMDSRTRAVHAIRDQIDNETIELDDREFDTLREAVAGGRWMTRHDDINDFNRYFENL